jgi:transposase
VFEIHRMKNEGYRNTKIAQELGISRDSVARYLEKPDRTMSERKRKSKLDPYKEFIDSILEEHSGVPGTVILMKIRGKGYRGGKTIVRDYIAEKSRSISRKAFIRFESAPGQQMQVDWGYFGTTTYGESKRKLYALAITESYSRMLYVEFAHSQKQAVLHQCLLNAFHFFGGTPCELLVDNMVTAVIERQGRIVRFNDSFLDFLRPLRINPVACNVRQPQEKGKIERSIGYIRQNFWPLRQIKDLRDANAQVRKWLDETANIRVHGTTGDKPAQRFGSVRLRSLPEHLPDCRDTVSLYAHKDFSIRYDNNFYTVPPWAVGRHLTIKADNDTVSIFYKDKTIAVHGRCFETGKRVENPNHADLVERQKARLFRDRDIAVLASLGTEVQDYLEALSNASQPVRKTVSKLLELNDEYGEKSLIYAVRKALELKAYGADYIENILYQEMTPIRVHPPVILKNEDLNKLRLAMPSLAEYDALALKRSRS